jgi:hypothetical protein
VARFLKFNPKFVGTETLSEVLDEFTNKPFSYGVSLSTSSYVGSVLQKLLGKSRASTPEIVLLFGLNPSKEALVSMLAGLGLLECSVVEEG